MYKSAGLFMVMSLLFACSAKNITPQRGGVSMSRVTGTISYLQRMALPPSSLITVQLVDVSRADSPAIVIGEQFFEAGGQQVPFVFEILYDPAAIKANHSYVLKARIEIHGKLRFINDQHYAVVTRDAPSQVDMVLKAVGGP